MSASRTSTPIDLIAERAVDTIAARSPLTATYIGRFDHDRRIDDFSPAGHERAVAEDRALLAEMSAAAPLDAVDQVTKADIVGELQLRLDLADAGAHLRDLNVIASPVQDIRAVFDLMPTETDEHWDVVAARLRAVPAAVEGYAATLREGIAEHVVPARRQAVEVGGQIERYVGPDGFFASFVAGATEVPPSLRDDLSAAAVAASDAYVELRRFLLGDLAYAATERDAVGRDLYGLFSRRFLGATIDLDETYEWGRAELSRMVSQQEAVAREIKAGATVTEAVAFLEADQDSRLHGTDALQRWMQGKSDEAVAALGRTHFDIPDPVRRLECMIAPTQEGGIYYTAPSDDFSRPGRMWWSVPPGVESFDTWRELTTVYHEGVPGHHLQIGLAVYNRAELNAYRRLLSGTSGHAEGWALYAERLMDELGYLTTPAERLGMLDGQRMRAARVVLDIGVHLEKPKPDGGGTWDADSALDFLRSNVAMPEEFVRFEVNRYLGWPGQAPSYKVGQRIWEQIRDEVRDREGDAFDIKRFHMRALRLGGLGLDTLRLAMAQG